MYRAADALLLRIVATGDSEHRDWPDLSGEATDTGRREWLRRVWTAEFADAVELASPALAAQIGRLCDGAPLPGRDVRRLVLSILTYRLRASGRATPFGLFAGVSPVHIGESTQVRLGTTHRPTARVEATWLAEVATRLETSAALRRRLPLLVNNLAFVRGGRVVLACRALGPPVRGEVRTAEVSVRATAPVLAAMDRARQPVGWADLADALAAEFRPADPAVIDAMLAGLVGQQFLLTALRAPQSVTDPLNHLIEHAEKAGADDTDADLLAILREVRAHLHAHDHTPAAPRRRTLRSNALTLLRGVHPSAPLSVDLLMDADVVVPRSVVDEAAAAAEILTHLSSAPSGGAAWIDYHHRFLDRYGPGAVVALRALLDPDVGLGYPAGYRDTLLAGTTEPPVGPRDTALLALAQRAARDGQVELVLDDAALSSLRCTASARQPHAEVRVRVDAPTREALDCGDFRLTVLGVSRSAGTITGRFLDVLDPTDRERMAAVYATLPTGHDAVVAQVFCQPVNPTAANVVRCPQVLPHRISIGEHDDGGPGAMPPADLAVSGDQRGLYLVSLSRNRPVEAIALTAIEFTRSAHPLHRFLCEISSAHVTPCAPFSWGAARHLPFLPRLRRGRTVIAPARWTVTAADIDAASWRDRIPRHVLLGDNDRRIPVDLDIPAHEHLLRDALTGRGSVTLREAAEPGAAGWIDGRAHELVVTLLDTAPAPGPRRPRWRTATTAQPGHLPGTGDWLSARLFTHPDRQATVLTDRLPDLIGDDPHRDLWFVRQIGADPHLRLRLRPAGPDEIGRLGLWAERLRADGLLGRLELDTYQPETGRFGHGAAIRTAETVFATDSAAAITQLANAAGPALTAASFVDLVTAFTPTVDDGLRWIVDHVPRTAAAPPRPFLDLAVRLAQPSGVRSAPGGDAVQAAWDRRRTALAAYRGALTELGDPDTVLPDLLHLHHARVAGIDHDAETACLHLARAAALSRIARS